MRKVPQIAASTTIRSGYLGVRRRLAKGAAVILLTSLVVVAPSTATAKDSAANRSGDPAVVSEWNEIAQNTLVADTTKAPVEDILYTLPAVALAAVYGVTLPGETGEVPAAAVVLRDGATLDAASLSRALLTQPPQAQPRFVRVVEAIAMTEGYRPRKAGLRAAGLPAEGRAFLLDPGAGGYVERPAAPG